MLAESVYKGVLDNGIFFARSGGDFRLSKREFPVALHQTPGLYLQRQFANPIYIVH